MSMIRTTFARQARLFSTSIRVYQKSTVESVVDSDKATAKTVDRAVSDQLLKGLEAGGKCFFFVGEVTVMRGLSRFCGSTLSYLPHSISSF